MSRFPTSLLRRDFLTGAAALFACASAQERAFAKGVAGALRAKRVDTRFAGAVRPADGAPAFAAHPVGSENIWLQRPDGEEIMIRFRDDHAYDRAAVMQLSWFMRDVADHNHAVWMEPRLFDLLAGVQAGLSAVSGAPVPLVVTSGYRTPAHNARIETAARNSMHLYGYAADLRAPGITPRAVGLAASFFAGGGIGLYDDFTHLDVWKVRVWSAEKPPAAASVRPGDPVQRPAG